MRDTRLHRSVRAPIVAAGVVASVVWAHGRTAGGASEPNVQAEAVLWLAPTPDETAARAELARGVSELAAGRPEVARPVFEKAAADPILGGYARLLGGRAEIALGRPAEAARLAGEIRRSTPAGALAEAALLLSADAAEAAADWSAVVSALRALVEVRPAAAAWLRLGRAAEAAGDKDLAREAFARVHYEHPLAAEAAEAGSARARLAGAPVTPGRESLALDLARAERLFNGRRHADARRAFEPLRALVAGDERAMVELRLAQCDYFLKRHVAARDALRAYLDRDPQRPAEAEFYYLSTLREMGRHEEYVGLVRTFVDRYRDLSWAESALNDLGTHYILTNDDGRAAEVFADVYRRYPTGAFADRAAWKAGWWAYKSGDWSETIRLFESAAVALRRADYRPAWLYWAARAHLKAGNAEAALAGYRRVITDYRNSYYGREATAETEHLLAAVSPDLRGPVSPASRDLPPTIVPDAPPPNAVLVRNLLAAGLYDDAIAELRAIARDTGSTPLIEATIALALSKKGELRPAITAMRRAYPQFMAAGGEALPVDMLRVIFPVDYWDLIHRHAQARNLDPFLILALVAQESTFQATVRSSANAYGLMQIVPATGRRYAQRLGIRPFATARLTEPEINVRIGTAYFADLLRQFGDVAAALAAYNAGEQRVSRWVAERPGVSRDEFIDDIPFPETQNYVRRILGTAEDYRLLYQNRRP